MVPGKGVEGAQGHPALAEGRSRVAVETADVGAHHGNAKHVEAQDACHADDLVIDTCDSNDTGICTLLLGYVTIYY